jgi:replication-associated recombination protein RarA
LETIRYRGVDSHNKGTFAGVKDIRQAIDEAQTELDNHGRATVLFVDEIHRFNKAQQDTLLPHVESGLVILVGGEQQSILGWL